MCEPHNDGEVSPLPKVPSYSSTIMTTTGVQSNWESKVQEIGFTILHDDANAKLE